MKFRTTIAAVLAIAMAGCTTAASSGSTADTETSISVVSTIFGTADTGNKSTLKKTLQKTSGPGDIEIYHYDENGNRVAYEEGTVVELEPVEYTGEAVITIPDADDAKIDSSEAVVKIAEGEGYEPEELILNNTTLDQSWENGEYHYTLSEGSLEWNMGDYPQTDENSGREWSCFGGDGNGYYTFTFEVSGIKYDGKELPAAEFPVNVYIWGRSAADKAKEAFDDIEDPTAVQNTSGLKQTAEIQWASDDERPVLCDNVSDNFYAVWPEGTSGENVTRENVTVTLTNSEGETYELSEDQFEVFTSETETQIALTFQYWPYTPVFDTLHVSIVNGSDSYENDFAVDTVYVYMVQQGGGGVTVDGTIVAYSFYGLDNKSLEGMTKEATYVLKTGEKDNTQYYAEDASGNGYLTSEKSEAMKYDAQEKVNPQLVANTILVTEYAAAETENKTVDGSTIEFTKSYTYSVYKSPAEMVESGVTLKSGYAAGEGWQEHEMWSWQSRFESGWTNDLPAQTASPYGDNFPFRSNE